MESQAQSSLLKLPPELRNAVYELIFRSASVEITYECNSGCSRLSRSLSTPPGILLACKQTYREAINFHYASTTFECPCGHVAKRWIKSVPKNRAMLSTVRILVTTTQRYVLLFPKHKILDDVETNPTEGVLKVARGSDPRCREIEKKMISWIESWNDELKYAFRLCVDGCMTVRFLMQAGSIGISAGSLLFRDNRVKVKYTAKQTHVEALQFYYGSTVFGCTYFLAATAWISVTRPESYASILKRVIVRRQPWQRCYFSCFDEKCQGSFRSRHFADQFKLTARKYGAVFEDIDVVVGLMRLCMILMHPLAARLRNGTFESLNGVYAGGIERALNAEARA